MRGSNAATQLVHAQHVHACGGAAVPLPELAAPAPLHPPVPLCSCAVPADVAVGVWMLAHAVCMADDSRLCHGTCRPDSIAVVIPQGNEAGFLQANASQACHGALQGDGLAADALRFDSCARKAYYHQ
jgi:hypothetical protein